MSEQYTIVTVSDGTPPADYYCLDKFFKSLSKYGIEPLVLNSGNMQSPFTGLGSKPIWQHKAIKEGLIKTKYCFMVDSWDLFFACHPDISFEKYLVFKSPIVFNSEKNFFPRFV
mgnify:CR=1 FL=1